MSTSQEPEPPRSAGGGAAEPGPSTPGAGSSRPPAKGKAKKAKAPKPPTAAKAGKAGKAAEARSAAEPTAPPVAPEPGRQGRARPEADEAAEAPGDEHRAHRVDRFPFRFHPLLAPAALAVGVTPFTAHVEVDEDELHVRFGPWSLRTPLSNVADVRRTGPYSWWKVVGPARVSAADRGVTFATTNAAGVCVRFREPVPAALPGGVLRHPGATVTVAQPDELVELLATRTAGSTD